jgi:hypothetical protein
MSIITLAGEKYRHLNLGEIIQKGDILVPNDDDGELCPEYLKVFESLIGRPFDESLEPIVRKIV